jgi:hypothetical protein
MLVLPAVARTAGQCSWLEKIRKRMSLHKPLQIPPLGQFVSDILGHPPIPNTKQSMLAMRLMSTLRQKKLRFGSSGKAPDLAIDRHANSRGRALFPMLPPPRRPLQFPLFPSRPCRSRAPVVQTPGTFDKRRPDNRRPCGTSRGGHCLGLSPGSRCRRQKLAERVA